jgi:hypothetical protein
MRTLRHAMVLTCGLAAAARGVFAQGAAGIDFVAPPAEDIQQTLRVGQPFAYSLCLGQAVDIPGPGEASTSLNPAQSPCGGDLNPSGHVRGGNPPYHFVLDPMGGFPPIGLVVDANGVLRGTPKGTIASTFRVCAVDLSAAQSCETITVQPQPALPANQRAEATPRAEAGNKGGGGGGDAALIIAGLAAAGGAAVLVASLAEETLQCAAGNIDCDTGCCPDTTNCCFHEGVGDGLSCCPRDSPHFCPSTNRCYSSFPSCDFVVCGRFVGSSSGAVAGGIGDGTDASAMSVMQKGNPNAAFMEGVAPLRSCKAQAPAPPTRDLSSQP